MKLNPTRKSIDQLLIERRRGWILKTLDEARPGAVELAVLSLALDELNMPMGSRTLASELDYLRSLKLIRVFMQGETRDLTDVEQALLMQRYADSEPGSEYRLNMCARIAVTGVDFQQGLCTFDGITRVE